MNLHAGVNDLDWQGRDPSTKRPQVDACGLPFGRGDVSDDRLLLSFQPGRRGSTGTPNGDAFVAQLIQPAPHVEATAEARSHARYPHESPPAARYVSRLDELRQQQRRLSRTGMLRFLSLEYVDGRALENLLLLTRVQGTQQTPEVVQLDRLLVGERSRSVGLEAAQDGLQYPERPGDGPGDDDEMLTARLEPPSSGPHPLLHGRIERLSLAQCPLRLDVADRTATELDPDVIDGIVRLQAHRGDVGERSGDTEPLEWDIGQPVGDGVRSDCAPVLDAGIASGTSDASSALVVGHEPQ